MPMNQPAASSRRLNAPVQPLSASAAPLNVSTVRPMSQPIVTITEPNPLIHPFQNVKDANYLPPANHNYASLPKAKDKEAGYHTVAPVQNPKIAEDIFARLSEWMQSL